MKCVNKINFDLYNEIYIEVFVAVVNHSPATAVVSTPPHKELKNLG